MTTLFTQTTITCGNAARREIFGNVRSFATDQAKNLRPETMKDRAVSGPVFAVVRRQGFEPRTR